MFLVTGTGSSGTSAVARVLHENLGVSMGTRMTPRYEDLDFVEINKWLLLGSISFPEWMARTIEFIDQRKEPWGLKDPHTSYLLGLYLGLLDSPTIVWCKRDREATVVSLMKRWDQSREEAERLHDVRLNCLENLFSFVPGVIEIDFTERRSDEEIAEALSGVLI